MVVLVLEVVLGVGGGGGAGQMSGYGGVGLEGGGDLKVGVARWVVMVGLEDGGGQMGGHVLGIIWKWIGVDL